MKLLIGSLITLCTLTLFSLQLAISKDTSNQLSQKTSEIRTFSITKRGPWRSDQFHSRSKNWRKSFYLSRPGNRNICAVVELDANGKAILNPRGYNYGPIPQLNKLKPSEAEQLWGKGNEASTKLSDSGNKTYALQYGGRNVVYIDLSFKESKITKYRVRSKKELLIKDQKWQIIN